MRSQNNLKQFALAIHNYDDQHGHLPGPIRSWYGRPLLSSRVALLPYLEEERLYREFHFDEPWDSPHNLTLLDRMPAVFRSVGVQPPEPNWTFYRVVTGLGTAFERPGLTLKDIEAGDGLCNTIFVVEAGEAVPWTKPEEWEYHPDRQLPPLGGVFNRDGWVARQRSMSDGTNVAFADGSVRFLPRDTPEATWRALVTRNGGEKVELP